MAFYVTKRKKKMLLYEPFLHCVMLITGTKAQNLKNGTKAQTRGTKAQKVWNKGAFVPCTVMLRYVM